MFILIGLIRNVSTFLVFLPPFHRLELGIRGDAEYLGAMIKHPQGHLLTFRKLMGSGMGFPQLHLEAPKPSSSYLMQIVSLRLSWLAWCSKESTLPRYQGCLFTIEFGHPSDILAMLCNCCPIAIHFFINFPYLY